MNELLRGEANQNISASLTAVPDEAVQRPHRHQRQRCGRRAAAGLARSAQSHTALSRQLSPEFFLDDQAED
ncbi:MAG: hypothetical protein LUG58_02355 [Clostridiales bacterium]|nr:hypothetical protein [Clostridiales bacterium]